MRLWIAAHVASSLAFAVMLVLVVSLLRSRRPPASTLAWIFAIIAIPYVGIPLYILFGFRKIAVRGRRPKVTGWPILPNLKIDVLTSGESAFAALVSEIECAKSSIDMATFIFSRDDVGQEILRLLTKRARQGLRIRLLVDAWGTSALVRPSFQPLIEVGGEVAFFQPLSRLRALGRINLRNHRKLVIFDDQIAVFGGMNMAHEYLGPKPDPKRWTDLCVRLEGQSLGPLSEVFRGDWKNSSAESDFATLPSALRSGEAHRAQIVASGPDQTSDPLYDQLLSACFEAKSRMWIVTPYFVPDEGLTKALSLASLRGVDVRVLVPRKSNHLFADLCRATYLRQLSEAGVKIYFYPKMTHAKLVLIDRDRALVGSANFDLRSLLYNYELGVFLYSETEVQRLTTWTTQRFAEAELVTLSRPGIFRETSEGLVRVFGPLF